METQATEKQAPVSKTKVVITSLAFGFGLGLSYAAVRVIGSRIADAING